MSERPERIPPREDGPGVYADPRTVREVIRVTAAWCRTTPVQVAQLVTWVWFLASGARFFPPWPVLLVMAVRCYAQILENDR